MPEFNSTTFNPRIQPYSYATATIRSNIQTTYADGVLIQPSRFTTLAPVSSKETPSLADRQSTPTPFPRAYVEPVTERVSENDTAVGSYNEDYLLPSERFKIVEENLFYETNVWTCTCSLDLRNKKTF